MHANRVVSRIVVCLGVAALAGCAKADKPVDTTAAVAPPATTTSAGTVAPGPIALADIAGTWKFRATPQGGSDTTVTEYTLVSTPTPDGWSITYANGLKVPVHVSVSGDSVITDAGPYASVRRKGIQVTTHGAFHKQGDMLVGTTTAHYNTKGADSVLTLHSEGTKAP